MGADALFTQLSIVVALGAFIAIIMRLLKQPLIVGHIITGVLAGPALFNIIKDEQGFAVLSNLGVALLLFIVGLELSLKIIARLSKVVFVTTIVQMGVITFAGALVASLLDFGRLESVVIGICLALSSTLIIVTMLQEKKETLRLFGQIAVGILLLQDIIATIAKIGLSAKTEADSLLGVSFLFGRGLLVIVSLYIASRYILPRMSKFLESSKELLLVISLGWALGIAMLCAKIGFSIEVGALFAGVSMAGLPFSHEISSRLRPMRDFFIIIFLITLGHTLVLQQISGILLAAVLFSLIVFIIKPFVILLTLGALGYTKRASFKTAVAMSQISEFSLVFVVAAYHGGYVSQEVQAVVGLTALITFAGSAYFIKYDDKLFSLTEKHLRLFERKVAKLEQKSVMHRYPVVLLGYRKGGGEFIRTFKAMNEKFVVVDYDPEAIELIERQKINYVYGDVTDVELIEELRLDTSKLVISTISDFATNEFLAHWLNEHNPSAVFVGSADSAYHAARLYAAGAMYVMMPHLIGSEKISTFIKRSGFKKSEFNKFREKHMHYLETHYSEEPA